jgi:hypothetical protein
MLHVKKGYLVKGGQLTLVPEIGGGERALHDIILNKRNKSSHLPRKGNYPRPDIGHHLRLGHS